jgi:hypothetical protein
MLRNMLVTSKRISEKVMSVKPTRSSGYSVMSGSRSASLMLRGCFPLAKNEPRSVYTYHFGVELSRDD